jgi:hypothetical protein
MDFTNINIPLVFTGNYNEKKIIKTFFNLILCFHVSCIQMEPFILILCANFLIYHEKSSFFFPLMHYHRLNTQGRQ